MRKYKIGEQNRYEISPNRYVELRYFCLQYDEMRKKAIDCMDMSLRASGGKSASGANGESAPERITELRERYVRDTELIERAAQLACGEDRGVLPFLMYSVTKGASYERVPLIPPCGRRNFYEKYRRAFFCHLDKLKR